MSVTNPERIVTKQDLADFYEGIFPYLGGNVEAGFTPIGTIIAVMGNSAPTNYLACNGQVVNIADYPELANYFKAQFGSSNYFGGNGTTTFAICDLRGEFLRGAGTNSHANQGSGASVGTHQDATKHIYFQQYYAGGTSSGSWEFGVGRGSESSQLSMPNTDSITDLLAYTYTSATATRRTNGDNRYQRYTARPTNTSVLYCIATKNIYMNPSLNFTEEEKVVGQWITGKPIYQKTWALNNDLPGTGDSPFYLNITLTGMSSLNIDNVVSYVVCAKGKGSNAGVYLLSDGDSRLNGFIKPSDGTLQILQTQTSATNTFTVTHCTVKYTKSTD